MKRRKPWLQRADAGRVIVVSRRRRRATVTIIAPPPGSDGTIALAANVDAAAMRRLGARLVALADTIERKQSVSSDRRRASEAFR